VSKGLIYGLNQIWLGTKHSIVSVRNPEPWDHVNHIQMHAELRERALKPLESHHLEESLCLLLQSFGVVALPKYIVEDWKVKEGSGLPLQRFGNAPTWG